MRLAVQDLQVSLAPRLGAFLEDLRLLSGIDCGTANKAGVDRIGAWVQARCRANSWQTTVHPRPLGGDIVEARVAGTGARRLLVLAHMDTVYPDGVAAARPMRFEGDRLLGPGTADMKAGLLAGIYAVEALRSSGFAAFGELVLLFTADEETGSLESRELIQAIAHTCDLALVLEAARASGAIVAARKGVNDYVLDIKGRAAHSGVEPEKGRSALLELAHKIQALQALNGAIPGVTVNVGTARGGIASNVVPDEATMHFEARAIDIQGMSLVDARIQEIAAWSSVPDTVATLTMRKGFPPMARTPAIEELAALARSVALELGFDVEAVSTGGASDASLVAGAGTPVLDGLGPIGGDDHSPREWVETASIVPRTAMLAGLIARAAEGHIQSL